MSEWDAGSATFWFALSILLPVFLSLLLVYSSFGWISIWCSYNVYWPYRTLLMVEPCTLPWMSFLSYKTLYVPWSKWFFFFLQFAYFSVCLRFSKPSASWQSPLKTCPPTRCAVRVRSGASPALCRASLWTGGCLCSEQLSFLGLPFTSLLGVPFTSMWNLLFLCVPFLLSGFTASVL